MKKIVILLLCIHVLSFSQEKNQFNKYNDVKVGLVLSGGGAKGFAHVGVIKVLEEAGLRIDYIGGTSAGAMVGALYASGYSAVELDSILRSYNYLDLIKNPDSRELYSLYQKENSERHALSLPIKNRAIGLPIGLSRGQNMLNELSVLTNHVHNITDFKKLPIPFFCVATNIETGKQEVLEKGFLPQAIRASGAFPSVFEPVKINNKYLLDGGITNGFPIDIMNNKELDVVIGVDVQGDLENLENLDSAVKIVMQIVSFQMYDDKKEKEGATDIYIKPDLTGINVSSFDKIDQIITSGEIAARKEIEYFISIASNQTKAPLKIREKIIQYKNKYLKIKKVLINGNNHYTRNYILSKLHLNRNKKDSISYKEFNRYVNALATTKNFKSIDYIIRPTPDGSIVEFNLTENDVFNFFKISTHYDNIYKSGVLLNYTSKHILTNNDILSGDIVLGDNFRYNLNYTIDNGFHWRFGISHRYNSIKHNIFVQPEEETPISFTNSIPVKFKNFTTRLYFQTKFSEKFALNGGIEHKFINISTEILNNNRNRKYYFDKSNYYNAFLDISLDTRDAKYFTKKGWYFKAKYNTYLYSSDYNENFTPFSQISIKLEKSSTYFNKLTSRFDIMTGITLGSAPSSFDYSFGGYNESYINNFNSFYGYDMAEIVNNNYLKVGYNIQFELFKKNYLTISTNSIIGATNYSNNDLLPEGFIKSGYAIGYGINSIVGPIEIKYGGTPDNEKHYWYFNFGYWF